MDLKNALAVCLISLFSATLVVLVARSLDLQAASRIEPQLERIALQLEMLNSGTASQLQPASVQDGPVDDGLIVYYFHGNVRCPTCESIESQARAVLQNSFASEIDDQEVIWRVCNYEEPSAAIAPLVKKFEIQVPVVVLARMSTGQVEAWKRLDDVWAFYDDEQVFAEYVQKEIRQIIDARSPGGSEGSVDSDLDIPVPGGTF